MPLRTAPVFALALTVLAAVRIVATHGVFNETFDEGVHIAAGMELLDRGTFTYEPKHPPLARVAVALGPYLSGIRSQGQPNLWTEGRAVLRAGNTDRTLLLARLGVLPFFLLACFAVWAWTRRIGGDAEALVAVGFFSLTPAVLAHAGLATTDMALAATLLALCLAWSLWLGQPTPGRSVLLGVAGAAALTSKLSAVPFFGLTLLLTLAARWWTGRATGEAVVTRRQVRYGALAAVVAFLCVWTLYHFQWGTLRGVPFPLTSIVQGIRDTATHNRIGHVSYLLGTTQFDGDWRFFPVALAVKTPLALLGFGLAGMWVLARRARETNNWMHVVPLLVMVAILASAIPARINIGVRHVLPIFGVLAIAAGVAVMAAWRRLRGLAAGRTMLVVLAIAGLWSTARVHPDYLAYFNELAQPHPERILVDSDLDWGQDVKRLADTLRARGIDDVAMVYFGSADPARYGVRYRNALGASSDTLQGWFVISQTLRQRGTARLRRRQWTLRPGEFDWLDAHQPVARIGRSLLLYDLGRRGAPADRR
jgi:hypothetical protein